MFFRTKHFHFIGIGGIGMSGIAELLLSLDYRVSGSDLKRSAITARLAGLGATIYEGHRAENVEGATAVVASSAVNVANPEVVEARRRGIPVIPRGEMLAELMRLKFGIAIGGSHGKTTTTSMIAAVMSHAGLDPTIVVGGRVDAIGSNARLGRGDFMVVEADESDGSFLKLAPIVAVITNIDREHLDHYRDLEEIRQAYTHFANRVPFYGAAIVCGDDPNIAAILPLITRRVIRYGVSAGCDVIADEITHDGFESRFTLRGLGEFVLRVPGRHNVLNAMAAVAAGLEVGAKLEAIREALAAYGGVDRRFHVRGRVRGVTVIDDYGHHPTEIAATLAAARSVAGSSEIAGTLAAARSVAKGGRVLVAFQPHRYTRTCLLMDEFAHAFSDADAVWITDIYAAGEQAIPGVSGESLVEAIRAVGHPDVRYAASFDQIVEEATREARAGDLVIALGAGHINQICEKMIYSLGMPL